MEGIYTIFFTPTCVLCEANETTVMMFPCRHTCMCASCAKKNMSLCRKCPICRHASESMHLIKDVKYEYSKDISKLEIEESKEYRKTMFERIK